MGRVSPHLAEGKQSMTVLGLRPVITDRLLGYRGYYDEVTSHPTDDVINRSGPRASTLDVG